MNLNKILSRHRAPVVGVRKRVLTESEVRWLSAIIAFVTVAALTILFVDEITLSSMIYEGEHYLLTPASISRLGLLIVALLLTFAAPHYLPIVAYKDENGNLKLSLYRSRKVYDDITIFRLWNGKQIWIHGDLVYYRFPNFYALIGPYETYNQGDIEIKETDAFEITQRLDFQKKLEMLEEQVSYWKTRALLSEAQLEEARRLTPTIIAGGGRGE